MRLELVLNSILQSYQEGSYSFFGTRDWAYLKAGIRELKVRGERDAGYNLLNEPRTGMSVVENL